MAFVHLHNHTEYSMLDGATKIKDMVRRAADLDMPAVAITDHGVMCGVPELCDACDAVEKETGKRVKPIYGCEIYFTEDPEVGTKNKSRLYHMLLLAKNNVLRPDALDGDKLKEVMSSGISFLNWLGQYDAAEQDRALERLSAYRASLTDSYDLDMFSRIVTYMLGDRDGLTDAGRAAQERFRAKFG